MFEKKYSITEDFIDENGHLSEVGYYHYAVQTVWEKSKYLSMDKIFQKRSGSPSDDPSANRTGVDGRHERSASPGDDARANRTHAEMSLPEHLTAPASRQDGAALRMMGFLSIQ